jgi:hypothetical protein
MTKVLTFLSLPAVAAALLAAAPAAAQDGTVCQPGDLFCLDVQIGPGRGGIRIGGDAPIPQPPPPVIVQPPPQQPMPQPPVVIVEPQYQPPVYQPPPQQPPQVYVQPQPQPQPQVVYMQQPVVRQVVRQRPAYPYSSLGVNLHLDGLWGEDLAMGGGGGSFRIRPMPHIAIDVGSGIYGGQDYNGLDRFEVPVVVDVLFFFNPHNRFQIYALAGAGISWSHAEGENRHTFLNVSRDYMHAGGQVGIGAEWRISRGFALNLDVRGFLRHRIDDSGEPEFTEFRDGSWQSTDLSGGLVTRFGATFYFGD